MQIPTRKSGMYTHRKADPFMTEAKYAELQDKLRRLKKKQLPLAEEVNQLRDGGDFSDNAGYAMAKGRLRGINQRIVELGEQLRHAKVITPAGDSSTIQLGHSVTVEIAGKQKTYRILGSTETDPNQGIISHSSPIGVALLGHRVGDTVTFRSATKTAECRVVSIE